MEDFMDLLRTTGYETNEYSLNIDVYTVIGGLSGKVLSGHSEFKYESVLIDRMHNIIQVFKEGFGYIVDYSINTNTKSKTYDLTICLKDDPEDVETPDEGEESPIYPSDVPTDPEEGENYEESEDATDENSHI